jgi:hypothetical protein
MIPSALFHKYKENNLNLLQEEENTTEKKIKI